MEYLWYIIASIGAGIGTGLAGLSAATVMVPMLIVLCPSFAGETGAYQATAIALASDILGSAAATITYARHKNIDLRRGWIMMLCILLMCTVGSYVAWLAGNVVLGNFTLFLTFFIGIRFLVKPDTSHISEASSQKMDARSVAISLFFGLTIGFGTGFVGTGGGMMMLVVFTTFLGMEVKTAVGTSTFIMTFTALIASLSHIVIHPAIVLDRWNVMLVCVICSTVSSLASAQFANKVKSRTVGLVTGGILTLLGAGMLILKYADVLKTVPVIVQTAECLMKFVLFIIPCIIVLLVVNRFAKLPRYVFRKLMHIVAFSCVTLMIMISETWAAASLASVTIALIVFPILAVLEKESWYSRLFVEKKPGEIKSSMLMLFLMFAAVTAISWGLFDKPAAAVASILMWGTGDAAAALVGIPFGRHKVRMKLADGKKSVEGSCAMLVISSLCGILILYFCGGFPLWKSVICGIVGGIASSATELFSPSMLDTVTVPVAIMAVLLLIV